MDPPPPVALEAAEVGLACHPRGSQPAHVYGTAGFRAAADSLDHVLFRMGILAALRSKTLGGSAVGLMVTASHNPERDNGVKLVEPNGEMLPVEWEALATTLANASDEALAESIASLAVDIDLSLQATVVVGRDTRASSAKLALAACDGACALRPSAVRSLGLATTPQLHYAVRCQHTAGAYGVPSLTGYREKLLGAYEELLRDAPPPTRYSPTVVVDCANGVGALALRSMLPRLSSAGLKMELINDGAGPLNDGCGADFVKIKQAAPAGAELAAGGRFASVDGDADRVVYFTGGAAGFRLLDGDRVALLLAHYLAQLIAEAGMAEGVRLGLVQTAYANGASTLRAVEALGAGNVLCAKTGVKHCHAAALELDCGIYFEANGHGTVLFSDALVQRATDVAKSEGPQAAAARRLLQLRDVINEAVGDAVANLLAVEALLRLLDWSEEEWLGMYADLPNRQVKVVVADRGAFETSNAERTCVRPEGLQEVIDGLTTGVTHGRAFVRPSGTEDVVRVYAEAASEEELVKLAQAVADAVYERAGGVGEKPQVA